MAQSCSWSTILDLSTASAIKRGIFKSFSKIKGNSSRVEFLLRDEITKNCIINWINEMLTVETQSISASKNYREKGNQLFSIKDYIGSVHTYTLSIATCPAENKEELSIAHANRSAALFHLELYEDCISDIEVALKLGYPDKLHFKIILRKAKCFQKLGKDDFVKTTIAELEDNIDNLKIFEKRRIEEDIHSLKAHPSTDEVVINQQPLAQPKRFEAQLLGGTNADFFQASAALDIRYTEGQGRHVVAKSDIKAGDTLFVENPSTLVVLPDFIDTRCHHCTKVSWTRYPCLQCGSTWFCSQECRNCSKGSYHSVECGLLPLLYSIGIAHLGFRIIVSAGLQELLDFHKNIEANSKIPGVHAPYSRHDYLVLFHLVSHTETIPTEELYHYSLTAALLILVLQLRTRFFHPRENIDAADISSHKSIVAGYLLTHICQMVCNAHAITELCIFDDDKKTTINERQERIATAIYPSASLMNHSCNPNVINSFCGRQLIVRAIEDVHIGEEVYNCYGPHYRRMRTKERQESLRSQYSFTCKCISCDAIDSEDFQDVIHSFRCPACQGSLISRQLSTCLTSDDMKTMCRSCKKMQNYFPQLKSDLKAFTLDAQGTEAMEAGDVAFAIKRLEMCVELRSKSLYKGHPDLGRSADKLAQCYALVGRYEDCARTLRITLLAVEEQYGRYSIEVANELQKFTDVLLQLVKDKREIVEELKLQLKRAALTYEIHYGVWSQSYREIEGKTAQLIELADCHGRVMSNKIGM